MKHLIIVFLAALSILSCTDEFDLNPLYTNDITSPTDPDNPQDPTGEGSYFFPLKVGNYWNYQVDFVEDKEYNYTYSFEIFDSETRGDTTIYNVEVFDSEFDESTYNEFFYTERKGYVNEVESYNDDTTNGPQLVLDENKAIGESWESLVIYYNSGEEHSRINRIFTMEEKLETFKVGDKTYEDVLLVDVQASYKEPSDTDFINDGYGKAYFAKNFGYVYVVLYNSNNEQIHTETLIDYTIK